MKVTIILLLLTIASILSTIHFANKQSKNEILRTVCGTVTYKSEQLKSRYKSTKIYNDMILYVKYKDREVQESVDIRTFETKNVGDQFCYNEYKRYDVFVTLGIPTTIILFGGLLASLFNLKSKDKEET